jgi:hypothetical protein
MITQQNQLDKSSRIPFRACVEFGLPDRIGGQLKQRKANSPAAAAAAATSMIEILWHAGMAHWLHLGYPELLSGLTVQLTDSCGDLGEKVKAVGFALRARWSQTTLLRSVLRPTVLPSWGVVTSKPVHATHQPREESKPTQWKQSNLLGRKLPSNQ